MSASEAALTAVVAASALHLGFQLTVTVLAYPALARVEDAAWTDAHGAHSRAIVPLVVLTYGALVLALGWALLVNPLSPVSPVSAWLVAAVAGASLSMLTTAVAAVPTHARLSKGRDGVLVRRLLVLDRVRTLAAVVCLVGALGAAVSAGG